MYYIIALINAGEEIDKSYKILEPLAPMNVPSWFINVVGETSVRTSHLAQFVVIKIVYKQQI